MKKTNFLNKIKAATAKNISVELYHGGDISSLKALKNKFNILSPDEKKQVPSTGGNKVGLSSSTDKKIALRYSHVFGNNKVIKFTLSPEAKIYTVNSKGKGIDEILSNDEITEIQKKYDAIKDYGCQEKEYRILKDRHVQHVVII